MNGRKVHRLHLPCPADVADGWDFKGWGGGGGGGLSSSERGTEDSFSSTESHSGPGSHLCPSDGDLMPSETICVDSMSQQGSYSSNG